MAKGTAIAMLFCAAFFWGAGNVANQTVLEHLDPATTVALRCLIAALIIAPLTLREAGNGPRRAFYRSGGLVSVLFASALLAQQTAFVSTTVTNASFLVNTASILTPLIAWVVFGEAQRSRIIIAAIVTVFGAFLMTGGTLTLDAMNTGDLFCLLSALLYAGWMVALGRHLQVYGRPYATSLMQFAVTAGVLGSSSALAGLPSLQDLAAATAELLVLGVFSTAAAFVLLIRAQQFVSPSVAAVLVSAESLFGAAGGLLFLGEAMTTIAAIGAGLILAAILLGMSDCKAHRQIRAIRLENTDADPAAVFISVRANNHPSATAMPPDRKSHPAFMITS